jgi:hypothetical protein
MGDLSTIGRVIIGLGVALVAVGILVLVIGHVPGLNRLGRLPGDIVIDIGNTKIYLPITTSIIISLFLSLLLWLFSRR